MAWRMTIKWKFISPVLRVATGTVHLENFDSRTTVSPPTEKYEWKVRVEEGVLGLEGKIPDLAPRVKQLMDAMTRSYFNGLLLRDTSCEWIVGEEALKKERVSS
jgi:hypothetical protein